MPFTPSLPGGQGESSKRRGAGATSKRVYSAPGKLLLDGVEEAAGLGLGRLVRPLAEERGAGEELRLRVTRVGDHGGGLVFWLRFEWKAGGCEMGGREGKSGVGGTRGVGEGAREGKGVGGDGGKGCVGTGMRVAAALRERERACRFMSITHAPSALQETRARVSGSKSINQSRTHARTHPGVEGLVPLGQIHGGGRHQRRLPAEHLVLLRVLRALG